MMRLCLNCGIEFRAYKPRLRFCSRPCASRFKSSRSIINSRTKKDLFSSRKNYQSARSTIRKHAYRVWSESNQKCECSVCGYSLYVEIAHKRAVSDFPDEATIQDINAIDNLVALCPNHHWEFDHKISTAV